MITNNKKKRRLLEEDEQFPLPIYEAGEDIYSKGKELSFEEIGNADEIFTSKVKEMQGGDLDIPGAESDDIDESIGEEDEENNYYSLGGENHKQLEEENPDIV